MSFGWANAWYTGLATDLDGRYATAVGHPIESTLCYLKPGWLPKPQTPAAWVTALSNPSSNIRPFYYDLMVPWATAAVPKRDLSVTIDIAPYEPSGPSGNWPSGPGGEDVAAITQWHTDMNNGLWDGAWIAFANLLTSTGLANAHVRPWHEPTWWNRWTSTVDYAGWLAAFNRMIGVFRANGLTGRMGPSLDGVVSSNYLSSTFPGSDCVYWDTYSDNRGRVASQLSSAVSYCRSHGLLLNFGEIGVARFPDGTQDTDAAGLQFFTEIHDWIQANQDVYEGMMYYNDNGSADILTGAYPQTLAYIRNNMPTWEISGAVGGGGGGTTGTNTATVTGSGSTAQFSGTCASNVLNVTVYRDTYGGTKLSDNTPSGGAYSYNKTGETNGAHTYVVAMFDGAALAPTAVLVLPGPFTLNLTINSATPTTVGTRAAAVTATGTNANVISGLTWPSGGSAPQSGDVAILAIAIGSGGTSPAPAGFTLRQRADNSTQVSIAVYTKVCAGTETGTITISNAGLTNAYGLMHASLHVKSNVDQTTPIDILATPNTTSNLATVAIPSITTTMANVLAMGFSMAVRYSSAASFTWTPPGALTEVVDVFGTEGGVYGKGFEVCEHAYAAAGPTGANTTTASVVASYLVSTNVGIRPAPAIAPTQSLSGFTVVKDLGSVAINIATVTSAIMTIKVMDGGVLQGSTSVTGSTASVSLTNQQSVGDHTYTIGGYDNTDTLVAGPYFQQVTVLAAPLITTTSVLYNDVRINANGVTTVIRIYETVANGGALVTTHPVDANGGWNFTSGLAAGRDYDTTAYDNVHESARVRFTTVATPVATTSVNSVDVDNVGTVRVVWQGLSLQLLDNALVVIETVVAGLSSAASGQTPGGEITYSYIAQPGDGHYTVTAYNNEVPASATVSDSASFDIDTIMIPVQTVTLVSASGTLLVSDASGNLIRIDIP